MNMMRGSSFAAFFIMSLGINTDSYAYDPTNMPVNCFPSSYHYQNYLYLRDSYLESPDTRGAELREALLMIPPIKINVKQTQQSSGSPITFDASGSTVPSNEAEYQWGSYEAFSDSATKTMPGGTPGSYSNIVLTVRDKRCDMEDSTRITVTSK